MYTVQYGVLSTLEADEILDPLEVRDTKLRELLTKGDDFVVFRRGKVTYAIKRNRIRMISLRDKSWNKKGGLLRSPLFCCAVNPR
ncbi:MAG: hypothetical protein ACFWUD_05125 [Thermocaproicibacter melissae]|jgi:hypothetical protein|uniref:hypothetical protein n=1 Tax=Thermocaproicibacter melissae TaxID=2966552 RepID=UPI0024B11EC6|nr:hypothetical protein [Thermocaproicibacter melissae]WBY64250.1 hypothetical protein NOG13_00595 [Thermocaproicibacter melissae]